MTDTSDTSSAGVRVVRSAGSEAAAYGRRELVAAPGVLIGLGRNPPGSGTGWHHHGDYDTYVYVLEGRARVEFGPGGREHCEGAAGDLLVVARGVVHRETTTGAEPSAALLVQVGTGAPMVPVEGPEAG